MVIPL